MDQNQSNDNYPNGWIADGGKTIPNAAADDWDNHPWYKRQCYFEWHIAHTPSFYWPLDVTEYYKLRNATDKLFVVFLKTGSETANRDWTESRAKLLKLLTSAPCSS